MADVVGSLFPVIFQKVVRGENGEGGGGRGEAIQAQKTPHLNKTARTAKSSFVAMDF